MGADIHMVLERRWHGRWVGVNAFPYAKASVWGGEARIDGHVSWPVKGRNYRLFAALAGVRGPGPSPRGMPDDVSDLARMEIEAWGADGHSHTWLLLDEALPLFVQHQQLGKVEEAVLTAFKRGTEAAMEGFAEHFYPMNGEDTLSDFRLVMWFDN